jgi:hypothetical protein
VLISTCLRCAQAEIAVWNKEIEAKIVAGEGTLSSKAGERSLYPTRCALCGAAEDLDDPEPQGFRNFYVSQHRHNAPMEQALCDAIGGEGFGRLCSDCSIELRLDQARIRLRPLRDDA